MNLGPSDKVQKRVTKHLLAQSKENLELIVWFLNFLTIFPDPKIHWLNLLKGWQSLFKDHNILPKDSLADPFLLIGQQSPFKDHNTLEQTFPCIKFIEFCSKCHQFLEGIQIQEKNLCHLFT